MLEFRGISKSFGAVKANQDLSFKIPSGSVHAIIGENGAGKSTAMKILFGLYRPDDGEIFIDGKEVDFSSPREAMKSGIGMVHQHFMLGEPFSALDNILLHQENPFWLRRDRTKAELSELAARYGFDVDLDKNVEDLPVGIQQRLEILKILSQNSDIIVLDEPTAVLTPQEIENLFINLKALQAQGKTIVIITHKLKEVLRWSDNVTVFRQGRVVAERKTSETSADELAELMIGHRPASPQERKSAPLTTTALDIRALSARQGNHAIQDIRLRVHGREIVGIAGVEGNGQDVLIQSLLDPSSLDEVRGDVLISGRAIRGLSTREIRDMGVGAFPEDRLRYGVLNGRPLYENFLLGFQNKREWRWGPFLNWSRIKRNTKEALKKFSVSPDNPEYAMGRLSGGNQQKLVVARELSRNPSFVLAAQPTRGVDIGAIEFIHDELRQLRDQGTGTLLISSELDELLALSDRILVLFKGHIVAEFSRAEFDSSKIGAAMGGKVE